MPQKISLIFSVTTNPTNLTAASARSGGWTESHWSQNTGPPLTYTQALAALRAPMLPTEASIVGYRVQNYNIQGNKLLPLGSASANFLFPGSLVNDLNLPQDGLQCSGTANASTNTTRFVLRAIPDSQIAFGEFQPTTAFRTLLQNYLLQLVSQSWGFVGRVKTGLSARVMSITTAGVITLNGPVGGAAGIDFLRLNRVYDVNGDPIKGTFAITNIAGNVYTCAGPIGRVVNVPSGSARIDAISFYPYGSAAIGKAVSKKIGRPSNQYHGRRSRIISRL